MDQVTLPADFPVLGDLTYEDFCRQFCYTFNLLTWIEAYDDSSARIGVEGLKKLHAQYQDRVTRNQVHSRRMNTLAALSALALASAGLDQAVEHDLDLVARTEVRNWYAEQIDEPSAVYPTKFTPVQLDKVDRFKNELDEPTKAMLTRCNAVGYVLTECREGRVYKPFAYEDHPKDDCEMEVYEASDKAGEPVKQYYKRGACGETFFDLDGYTEYRWDSDIPGKINDPYSYGSRHWYSPVSPSAEELCVEKKDWRLHRTDCTR